MAIPVYVIIVTHDSAVQLEVCLAHLEKQTVSIKGLAIVDSGSADLQYLEGLQYQFSGMKIIKTENVGYSRANNIGYQAIVADTAGMVVFMNPDTFLPPDFFAQAVNVFNENPGAAVVSGKLLGYDIETMQPSGKIDSTGIFRRWYGRWYDRGQGEKDRGQYDLIAAPPALCGALLCCRVRALLPFKGEVFDPDFFLYKEDIEFCLRLQEAGWTLVYDPRLIAHHCRGWTGKRRKVSLHLRLIAAGNEVMLYRKHRSPAIVWALLKLFAVKIFRL